MRQLTTIFLLIILCIGLTTIPSYSTIKGGINYSIPIDYQKLSEVELEQKARVFYFEAMKVKDRELNDDITNALILYSILQNKNPMSIEYSAKLGILYDKLGKDRYAKGNFSRTISINPSSPIGYFYYAEFYYKREQYKKALKCYKKAYELGYNTNYETLYRIGDIYQKFGDTESALQFLSQAAKYNPSDNLLNKIKKIDALHSMNKEYYSK